MIEFEQVITAAAAAAGERPVVAAPYPLSEVVCRELARKGVIAGYIAERPPDPPEPDPLIAGWWIDRAAGLWFLRPAVTATLLMLSAGPGHDLDGVLLLEARLKGVRRILYVDAVGTIVREVEVVAALLRLLRPAPLETSIRRVGYDGLFAEIYELLSDGARLPSASFVPGRILLLIGSLGGGGAERQAAYTAAGLAERFPGEVFIGCCAGGGAADFFKPVVDAAGVEVRLVSSYDPPDLAEMAAACERLTERYGSLGAFSLFQMIVRHVLLIRALRPEIVHTWLDYSNTLGGIAADLVGVPRLVISGRSLAPDNFAIFQPYMEPAYRAILARRDAVLLNNSWAGARDYARWLGLPSERFRVVANGFPPPPAAPGSRAAIRAALGIPAEAIVVGGLIGFREEKRPLLWLEMARLLHRDYPQLRFVIYGDGVLRAACQAFVTRAGLGDVVSLPGETTDSWAALSAMDIFVLTSRAEGLPNVMIEAQFVGLPVVCTGVGGMHETFVEGETGFGVAEASAEALSRAVARLVEDPGLRAQMREAAPRHARAAFGLDRMIDETIAAYRAAKDESTALHPDWLSVAVNGTVRLGGIVRDGAGHFVAECPGALGGDRLALWEDDIPLRPAGAGDRLEPGGGQYRLAGPRVYFTSSDGSDPRFNGRVYSLRPPDAAFDEFHIDSTRIQPETGHCYIARLDPGCNALRLGLWEGRRRLSPGGCLHDDIRALGGGRYSVWGDHLYFSTSDNSDPRTNGRSYLLRREKARDVFDLGSQPDAPSSPDVAFAQLLSAALPRPDFVPGRVVHIGGSLGPGGAERQIVYTLTGLRQWPIESAQLLCYHLGTNPSGRYDFYLAGLQAEGVPVRPIRRFLGEADFDLLPRSLRALRHALPPDLVTDIGDLFWEFVDLRPEVVHAWLDGNLDRAGIAAALAGVPRIVLGARNLNPTHFAYARAHMLPAYRALLALPQVTMVNNSRAGRDDFAAWLGVDPATIPVIYNGIDFAGYRRPGDAQRSRLRRRYGIDPRAFLVGGVFRFFAEKDPLLWVETAAEVARRLPRAQFIVFGSGEMRPQMEQAARRLGVDRRLVFGGTTHAIMDALSMMDAFLLVSRYEGIPNVVLEAQWVGTPVVATRAGGTPEAVEQGVTGWIVGEPRAAALAERLVWLHDNPPAGDRARRRGPDFVKSKFAVERMVRETVSLYRLSSARMGQQRAAGEFENVGVAAEKRLPAA